MLQAWAAEKEQKRALHSVRAEKEALGARLCEGEALISGVEARAQELATREHLLQATQRKLEDALTRARHEASLREDALRAEVADMRRRWQVGSWRKKTQISTHRHTQTHTDRRRARV